MNILLARGLGFIGSLAAIVLSQDWHQLVLLDNLLNSQNGVLGNLEKIIVKMLIFINEDVRITALLKKLLAQNHIDAVTDFAGLKAVGDSNINPVDCCSNNVAGIISLIQAMQACGLGKQIFSSSATVCGDPVYLPCNELHPTNLTGSNGIAKLQCKEIVRDQVGANSNWSVTCLRFFNPVRPHPSVFIGEDLLGVSSNMLPYVTQVVSGKPKRLNIFGDDCETQGETDECDHIHVMDMVKRHVSASDLVKDQNGLFAINLGGGLCIGALALLSGFEKAPKKFPIAQFR